MEDFSAREYKRSRTGYIAHSAGEYFIVLLVTDAFLAKLLKGIGMTDASIGIVSSLVSCTFLVQLLAIPMLQHVRNIRRTVIFFNILAMVLFLCTYLLPFVPFPQQIKHMLVYLFILGGFLSQNFVSNTLFRWATSYVEPDRRARFSARNEIVSCAGAIVYTLAMGYVVDQYAASGNISGGFLFCAVVIALLTICNFIFLLCISDSKAREMSARHDNWKIILQKTFGSKGFRSTLVMLCLYEIARYFTVGFLGTYKTQELGFSLSFVQWIGIAATLMRIVFSVPIARYTDKNSYVKGYTLGILLTLVSFLCLIFTTEKSRYLIGAVTILYSVAQAGINANAFNINYSFVEPEYFVQAAAISFSVSGIVGFLASLAGSAMMSAIQSGGNTFFGFPVYAQQVMGAVSCLVLVAAALYAHLVVAKMKPLPRR